ncbi:unnamed protein product, partial [Notodromas monacha]
LLLSGFSVQVPAPSSGLATAGSRQRGAESASGEPGSFMPSPTTTLLLLLTLCLMAAAAAAATANNADINNQP